MTAQVFAAEPEADLLLENAALRHSGASLYSVSVDDGPAIQVHSRSKSMAFAIDHPAMNPLEGLYAPLAGCAAVYVKKACHALRLPAAGIRIHCRPHTGQAGPPARPAVTDFRTPTA